MLCSCCGLQRDPHITASLHCRPDVTLCRECIGWLSSRAGGIDVTPTLPVVDMDASCTFFEAAGFEIRRYDDGFAFVTRDEQSVFDLDLVETMDPATNHAGCYIIVADVDAWYDRLLATGMAVSTLQDMPWGMHEFTLRDPSGNQIRIGRPPDD